MISIKKLYTLKTGTRLRKIVRILTETEQSIIDDISIDDEYMNSLYIKMKEDSDLSESVQEILKHGQKESGLHGQRRFINTLRHSLLNDLGLSQADWDFIHPRDEIKGGKSGHSQKGLKLFLDEIRSPFNIGSIFRSAECMGVEEIILSTGCADPEHPRAKRTAMGCIDKIPWRRLSYQDLAELDTPLFALELGGDGLESFNFPQEGVLILGSEEVGVSPECLALSSESYGQVSIPLTGTKASLNVSVAFGIVMYAWSTSI